MTDYCRNIKINNFSYIQSELVEHWNKFVRLGHSAEDLGWDDLFGVGYLISPKYFDKNRFPFLSHFIKTSGLVDYLNPSTIRMLFTDPAQYDKNTSSKRLDRYNPHVDKKTLNEPISASLNFPILGYNDCSSINWYDFGSSKILVDRQEQLDEVYGDFEEYICASVSMSGESAYLVRTDIFHSVVNNSNGIRCLLAWHFKPEYSWDDILKISKEYTYIT